MSWYEGYKNQWTEIIGIVAEDVSRAPEMVEKDTIQSMFLLELSRSGLPFVFKGGTSLSKAFGLIGRFSEDIDLSMDHRPTESERKESKTIILGIAGKLGLVLTNPDAIQSRHSYNKYVFRYPSLFKNTQLRMIVETSFYQAVYPTEIHSVDSMVGKYCASHNIHLSLPFEAGIVMMPVQTLERTFVDKVFAICDYRIQNMEERDSRHLYDIAKLLPQIHVTPELKDLIDRVREDRMSSRNNPSAQPKYDIPWMLKEIISSHFYEEDYNNITRKLLYEDISYEEAISNGIAKVAETDLFDYRDRKQSE